MQKRKTMAVVVATLIAYFLILPELHDQMPMQVSAHIPEQWSHDRDMPVEITISAWHGNYEMALARFVPDYHASELRGETDPVYPQVLAQKEHRTHWNRLRLNRFTWPRRDTRSFEVPLSALAAEGRLAPGTLRGEMEITLRYPRWYAGTTGTSIRSGEDRERIPFEISF